MAKILLADDEEGLRLLMSRQLRRAGHEVVQAEDGLAALDLLRESQFDVVVSDVKMPRLDGMGLLERAAQIAPGTEFVILTGHGSLENAVEAFKTGHVFDYLLKPLEDIRELDAVVSRAVERRQLRVENARLIQELQTRIDELEEAKRQLAGQAERDGLTGLLNHRAIHQRLEALLESASEPITIMMLDIDDFKLINDTYGHPAGDQVLRYLAAALENICGDYALIGRCGGDEFMIALPGMIAPDAQQTAVRVRDYLAANPYQIGDRRLPIRVCFGLADTQSASRSPLSLVAAADTALYEGKRDGGNQVILHLVSENSTAESTNRFDVLEGLVIAIDRKDRYTKQHSEDVTTYALSLVRALGLSPETYQATRIAGLLHDIGKIGVPDSILRKPGKLTAEEYEVMKGHVTLSELIIHGLPHLPEILDAVANHHERWDGKGYPKALAGEEIPLLGRIMAIADAFSAMTLDRPYRSGLDLSEAFAELERGAGSQFDPELARLFVDTMKQEYSVRSAA